MRQLVLIFAFVLAAIPALAQPALAQPRPIALPGADSGLPFSAAVEAGDFVYLSGALGFAPGSAALVDGVEAQAEQTLANLDAVLAAAGVERSRVVDARIYLADRAWYSAIDAAIGRRFPERPPATTAVEVDLAVPGATVEVSMVAARPGVEVRPILPEGWPAPRSAFSRAVLAGDTLFLAGQVGVDVPTRTTVAGGTREQTAQALANVRTLVETAGMTLRDVAACRVYLADARDFAAMNEAWRAAFPADPPTRETVRARLAEADLRVEVACVAVRGERRVIVPEGWAGGTPFSPAIAAGGRLFVAGMVARAAEGWPQGVPAQTALVLEKLGAALAAAGLGSGDVVEAMVTLSDVRTFGAMNDVYRGFFDGRFPARATIGAALMAPEALVEISLTAALRAP